MIADAGGETFGNITFVDSAAIDFATSASSNGDLYINAATDGAVGGNLSVTATTGNITDTAAHDRGDRLGGIIFGDSFCAEMKPRLGRQAALRYLHNISSHPDWKTSVSENEFTQEEAYLKAATALRRVVRPGSLVVIISDFLGFSRMSRSHIARLSQHNEILAIFVSDPMEETPPPAGRYRIVCADEDISVDTYSKRAREKYSHTFKKRKLDTYDFFRRYGIHRMAISTSDDPIEELKRSLGRKNR